MSTESLDHLVHVLESCLKDFGLLGKPIAVAWSGGLDSTALVLATERLCEKHGFKWAALHFDHGLRSSQEREKENQLVRSTASRHSFELIEGAWQPETRFIRGMEADARDQRRVFFKQTAASHGFCTILTAHHAQDQDETRLMRLFQGRSYRGLKGIPRQSGLFLHPFLEIPQELLRLAVTGAGEVWWEDSTNQQNVALRNRVRNQLVPLLNQLFPKWSNSLKRAGVWTRQMEKGLLNLAGDYWSIENGLVSGPWDRLNNFEPSVGVELLLDAIGNLSPGTRISRQAVEKVLERLKASPGEHIFGQVLIERRDSIINLRPRLAKSTEINYLKSVRPETPIKWGNKLITLKSKASAEEIHAIGGLWFLSGSQASEIGVTGFENIKAFWNREKIPRSVRMEAPVLLGSLGVIGFVGSPWGEKDFFFPLPGGDAQGYFYIDYKEMECY